MYQAFTGHTVDSQVLTRAGARQSTHASSKPPPTSNAGRMQKRTVRPKPQRPQGGRVPPVLVRFVLIVVLLLAPTGQRRRNHQ